MGSQRVAMAEELNKNSKSLHLSYLENQYLPSWWHQILLTRRKRFVKWVLNGTELRLHQNLIYWPSPTTSLEQYPRVIWVAASLAAVLILPPVKLNSSQVVHLFWLTSPSWGSYWPPERKLNSSQEGVCVCFPVMRSYLQFSTHSLSDLVLEAQMQEMAPSSLGTWTHLLQALPAGGQTHLIYYLWS